MGIGLGEKAIDFALPGVDGNEYSLDSFEDKRLLAVIFTCNHCPYAQAYQDRIKALQAAFDDNLAVVAINPNDAEGYPEDDFQHMKIRAREQEYTYPYLRDKSQDIAQAYGAEVTPDVFLFDEKRILRFRGRIDDNWENPSAATMHDLQNAIQDLLAARPVKHPEVRAIGCSVKWKPSR